MVWMIMSQELQVKVMVQVMSCFQVGVFNGGFEGAGIKIATSVLKIGHDLTNLIVSITLLLTSAQK